MPASNTPLAHSTQLPIVQPTRPPHAKALLHPHATPRLSPSLSAICLLIGLLMLIPMPASAGLLEGLVGMAEGLVQDLVAVLQVLLLGYFGVSAFLWFSGSPDAKRHTGYALVGGALLFLSPTIIDSLRGQFGG